jgi:hypothetical protein
MAEIYDFDDFFLSDNDPGVEVPVKINGRTVPIWIKRALSTGDYKAAQAKAVMQSMGPDGKLTIKGMDEEAFAVELVAASIVSWPFTQKKRNRAGQVVMDENGDPIREPVPVTRENVRRFLAEGTAYLQAYILGAIERKSEAVAGPFESQSGAPS